MFWQYWHLLLVPIIIYPGDDVHISTALGRREATPIDARRHWGSVKGTRRVIILLPLKLSLLHHFVDSVSRS